MLCLVDLELSGSLFATACMSGCGPGTGFELVDVVGGAVGDLGDVVVADDGIEAMSGVVVGRVVEAAEKVVEARP